MLALALHLALTVTPASGTSPTPPGPTAEARFDAMARRHLLQFQALLSTRGVPPAIHRHLPLAGLQAVLAGAFDPETAVLVYDHRAADRALDAWLVGADGIRAHATTAIGEAAVEEAVAGLRVSLGGEALLAARAPRPRGLKRPGPAPAAAGTGQEAALSRLGALLLPPPIAAALGPVRDLLVAPTLGLGAVPFAALPLDGKALIEDRTITVLPNLFGLGAVGAREVGGLRPALVVGDPDLSGDPAWEFPPLPGARAEARHAATLTGAAPLLAREATRPAVEARAREAELVYLATHGVALPDDPMAGFLALAGPGGVDRWTARQIQGSALRARLAVLSACQTGLGRGLGGGVIGVARAFQLAGVPSVVMSLWSVDDAATAHLMRSFLEQAAELPPAQALRRAMLQARTRHPDPLRWASFALFATPAGRPGAGIAQGGARLVLVDRGGRVFGEGAKVPLGEEVRWRIDGDEGAPRRFRYLVSVSAGGEPQLVPDSAAFAFTPPLGREALALVEADRELGAPTAGEAEAGPATRAAAPPAGAEVERLGPWTEGAPLPRTLAGLAALFPLEEPALRLRILQLQVETVEAPPEPAAGAHSRPR